MKDLILPGGILLKTIFLNVSKWSSDVVGGGDMRCDPLKIYTILIKKASTVNLFFEGAKSPLYPPLFRQNLKNLPKGRVNGGRAGEGGQGGLGRVLNSLAAVLRP